MNEDLLAVCERHVFNTMRLSSHDPSCKKEALAARAKGCSQRLARVAFGQFLTQRNTVKLGKKKEQSSPPMPPTDSYRLERCVSTRPAHLDVQVPPAIFVRKKSAESSRKECSKRQKAFTEPESEKRVRFEKPSPA